MKKSILILALIIPMLLSAQRMEKYRDFHGKDVCLDGLELTDQQKEQIRDIKTSFQKDRIKLDAELKLARLELHELITDNITGGKLDKAVEKVNNARSDLFSARIKQRVEIRNLLTDDQKEKLGTMTRAKMGQRRHDCADDKREYDTIKHGRKLLRRHRR